MTVRALSFVLAIVALPALTGCGASARFYSKNGRAHTPVTDHAVHCEENEAQTVAAAGAEVIGTISGKAVRTDADHAYITEKAQIVAARKGGTHIVLTEKGEDFFTVHRPGQIATECVRTPGAVECQSVATPATSTTYSHVKASFVVLRLAPQRWANLAAQLRPVPRPE